LQADAFKQAALGARQGQCWQQARLTVCALLALLVVCGGGGFLLICFAGNQRRCFR
jgi:hypothetical protein